MTTQVKTIHRTKINSLLDSIGKQFFYVIFIKKDKEVRRMNCFLPKPKEKPKRASNATPESPYRLVVDLKIYRGFLPTLGKEASQDKAYRLVNLATILEIHTNGEVYRVVD